MPLRPVCAGGAAGRGAGHPKDRGRTWSTTLTPSAGTKDAKGGSRGGGGSTWSTVPSTRSALNRRNLRRWSMAEMGRCFGWLYAGKCDSERGRSLGTERQGSPTTIKRCSFVAVFFRRLPGRVSAFTAPGVLGRRRPRRVHGQRRDHPELRAVLHLRLHGSGVRHLRSDRPARRRKSPAPTPSPAPGLAPHPAQRQYDISEVVSRNPTLTRTARGRHGIRPMPIRKRSKTLNAMWGA